MPIFSEHGDTWKIWRSTKPFIIPDYLYLYLEMYAIYFSMLTLRSINQPLDLDLQKLGRRNAVFLKNIS